MQTVTLMPEELELLRQLLHHAATELDLEVSRADNIAFKRMLKARRDILAQLMTKVRPYPAAAAA